MISKKAMLATAFALAFTPGLAWAAPGKLVLVIGGEAYDGPPKFAITFDGKPLAEGAVDKAIDTGTDKRFAEATDKTQYVQSFSYDIPDADFRPSGEVRVRLLNEAYGGEGSNRDRNLFIGSISVNGQEIKAANLATVTKAGLSPNEMVGDYLAINDGTAEAVSLAPEGGWPEAGATQAEAKPAAPEKTVTAAEVTPPPAETKPVEPAPAAAKPEQAAEATKPAAAGKCSLEKSFDVTGFGQNSNDLTPATNKQLDAIVEAIGEQTCSITLTGYSDTFGSHATNALFSVERAQNALKYLRDKGIKFEKAQATGVGETDKFGPSARANRRVVIAIAP